MKFKIEYELVKNVSEVLDFNSINEAYQYASKIHNVKDIRVTLEDIKLYPGDILLDNYNRKHMLTKVWTDFVWSGQLSLVTLPVPSQFSRNFICVDDKFAEMVYLSTVNKRYPEFGKNGLRYSGKNIKEFNI